jgi:hypothetical protein
LFQEEITARTPSQGGIFGSVTDGFLQNNVFSIGVSPSKPDLPAKNVRRGDPTSTFALILLGIGFCSALVYSLLRSERMKAEQSDFVGVLY